jgi:AraC-like DNA-binding protein
MVMFFDNDKLGLILRGVYLVELSNGTVSENGRKHSALSFRIKGESAINCNDKSFFLGDNAVAYFPKGVDYTRVTEIDEKLISLHFETFGRDESEIELVNACDNLRPFFETILEHWNRKDYNKCMRTVYKIFDEIKSLSAATRPPIPASIAKGVEYMEANFRSHELTISDLAQVCHISETYFRRIFGAHFGTSPINALQNLRFNYAKSLLRSGYYQIKEVALLSGFNDTKYFRVAFKRQFGITPNEYATRFSE